MGYNSLLDKKIESYVDECVTASYSDVTENTLIQEKEEVEDDKNTENNDNYEVGKSLNNTDEIVWLPSKGSRYHDNPNCSKMKNPTQVTKSQAISMGYTACKKCF